MSIADAIRARREEFWPIYRAPEIRAISVDALVASIRAELGYSLTESEVEEAVIRLGGRRSRMIDPWGAPARWLARLAKEPVASQDLFEVPAGVLGVAVASADAVSRRQSRLRVKVFLQSIAAGGLFGTLLGLMQGKLGTLANVAGALIFTLIVAVGRYAASAHD